MDKNLNKGLKELRLSKIEPDFDSQLNLIHLKINGFNQKVVKLRFAAVCFAFLLALSTYIGFDYYQKTTVSNYLYSMTYIEDSFFVDENYF